MLLVVIGHTLTPFLDTDAARGLWAWIYAFHVPAFVFLSRATRPGTSAASRTSFAGWSARWSSPS